MWLLKRQEWVDSIVEILRYGMFAAFFYFENERKYNGKGKTTCAHLISSFVLSTENTFILGFRKSWLD